MPDDTVLTLGADAGDALAALAAVKEAIGGLAAPAAQLKSAFAEAGAAVQNFAGGAAAQWRANTAALAAFKSGLQELVSARQLSLQQALGFDIDYTAQLAAQERARIEAALANDAATLADKAALYEQLDALGDRYATAIARDQAKIAEAARRTADRIAQPFRQAFDEIGAGLRSALAGLLSGGETARQAQSQLLRSLASGGVGLVEGALSKAAAGPLAQLLGGGAAPGEGVGDVLGNTLGRWLFGAQQQVTQGATTTANTAAIVANTSALAGLTATLGAAGAITGASGGAGALATGGAAAAGTSAAGGGLFGWLAGGVGGVLGFSRGGIVPSAAGGWALPSFAGATPALLHSREMVLPADLSQGLQEMIGSGGATGAGGDAHFHAHFHGPADAPAISRWFRDNLHRNAGAVRDLFRSNTLTPRSL